MIGVPHIIVAVSDIKVAGRGLYVIYLPIPVPKDEVETARSFGFYDGA
jgi:hypothetical protein